MKQEIRVASVIFKLPVFLVLNSAERVYEESAIFEK